jgi:hypothetical protein
MDDQAKLAADGHGAWRNLAARRDLVAELLADRRAEAQAEDEE